MAQVKEIDYTNGEFPHHLGDGVFFENQVLTTNEASSLLRVSSKTLLKLVKEEKIPSRKTGRHYKFLLSELENWMKG
jgi:excisionase family DNA binding protein